MSDREEKKRKGKANNKVSPIRHHALQSQKYQYTIDIGTFRQDIGLCWLISQIYIAFSCINFVNKMLHK